MEWKQPISAAVATTVAGTLAATIPMCRSVLFTESPCSNRRIHDTVKARRR